jgi:type I restriction enzyme S subunit
MVSGKMVLLRPNPLKVSGRVLAQLLALSDAQKYLDSRTTGMAESQVNFANSALLDLRVSVPPMLEQRRIAEVLATLDEAIAVSERLVVKLEALRAGVARSLFDDLAAAPMRPLADLCVYFDDGDWIETPFIADTGVRLIQTGNIGLGDYLDRPAHARFVSESTFQQLHCKPVHGEDLLFCRLADPVGRACQVPDFVGPAITSVDCSIIRVDPRAVEPRFLLHWASQGQWLDAAERLAAGSTRKRISRSNLGRLGVPTPPIRAQREVAGAIDAALARVERARTEVSKLRAVRLALEEDLLTGRVRAVPV